MAEQVAASQASIAFLVANATCIAEFASALSSVYALLSSLHLLKHLDDGEVYSTPALRHELRMKPYLPIGTPTLPSSDEMDASTLLSPNTSFSAILTTISSRLTSAKTALSTWKNVDATTGNYRGCERTFKAEVQSVFGSIVATGITVSLLKKTIEECGLKTVGDVAGKEGEVKKKLKVDVVGEKKYSSFWAVPKVSAVA